MRSRQTIREPNVRGKKARKRVIVMNWSGHGLMDLAGYEAFFDAS